jgi:hypothetical protein
VKRIVYKALFITVLVLINKSVFGQTVYIPDSTYYLNSPSGSISRTGTAYSYLGTKTWKINTGTQKPVKIDFEIDIVAGNDYIYIYAVNASGDEYLLHTVTSAATGSISTILPTGKAKIQFNITTGGGGPNSRYDGFSASFSVDNNASSNFAIENAYVDQDLLVRGSARIGTATSNGKLTVSAANPYGIYSVNNGNSRNSYGIYSIASLNKAGNLYGLYSSVSGTESNKWAGYFTGGDVEVTGGILKANNGVIVAGGNVGIGTTTPSYNLDVSGTSRTTGNAIFSGNVGIGTTSPAYKLDVNGIIRTTEVKIETGWADFVFNDGYRLKPLSEVETFIKANKHLPEIPSATEIKENEGVNLGEMQVKLLQKIEELTLYLIQQENTIQELKNAIRELKEK